MPTASSPEAAPPVAADAAARSRVEGAVAGLGGPGLVALVGGMVALFALLAVSLLLGSRGPGAVLAVLGAAVAAVAARQALAQDLPTDSATVVTASRAAGLVSAVLALGLLLLRPAGAQPPIQVPQPLPSPSASQPQLPTPGPSTGARRPGSGSGFGFGIPTQPDTPLTQPATDKGTLTGLVVDTAGKPVVGATVVVDRATQGDTSDTPECPVRSTARTDSSGSYSLELCQLGQDLGYQVTITAAGAIASNQLFVNAGRTTRYDVILAIRTS